ncbi:hypothetical protein SEA_VORVOLAKOS_75 [Streptomyces phage Vorvolakos]|uniref:Uncharacterized protein n=3 Tax=Flowerpowervirus flowerpower TaxID=2846396 RepID=A0A2U8UNB9_9CAUD|nr:hypothetical protein HWB61_gp27 [Streptomyces phage FlowerPower]QEA11276.1 hypothetical protein SEA_GEOSTIN_69 [Streptomyces phage Geostin]QFP94774.1 hypothetical protein SEA_FABIAN_73 [Streptomyces phage Fabian]QZD97120.1 hypothetical protein SEA_RETRIEVERFEVER_74 [Streptomyces phage RetrieverFever]UOW93285.1 hypothetical protein SEA_VORVOLAKOS_75 [Streptomyces phage Vorvolakos]AWN05155.1 hypothetical protein SEA_FLOWERPOWER_74 [Streptomyces phage FlowerPower]
MIDIDIDRAKALVNELIAERGADYVYEKEGSSCKYVHGVGYDEDEWGDGEENFSKATPGCLVGAVLHKAGVPLESMGTYSRNDEGSYDLIEHLTADELVHVSQEANNFLGNVQASQDAGAPWGLAAEKAAQGMILDRTYDYSVSPAVAGPLTEREGSPVA